jgi:hypothetical protein
MAAKRRPTQEPLLNTVARKLGHAAGTLTRTTHELTDTLTTKMHQAATVGTPKKRSRRPHKAKAIVGKARPKPLKNKSPRRRVKPAKSTG